MAAPALIAVACSSSGSPNTGNEVELKPENLISNFEDTVAVVTQDGNPPRNGYWYSYNDGSTGCMQMPRAANKMVTPAIESEQYVPATPPSFPDSGTANNMLAIHTIFSGCATWGAGVGADLNQPPVADGGTYDGPKVEYDISQYKGLVFWARTVGTGDTHLRVKVNMSDETKIEDGGKCDETVLGTGQCSNAYGQAFTLPSNGNWYKVLVDFSKTTAFKQESWGKTFTWNPMHAVSIQIQSTNAGEAYEFWLDDVYFWN